MSESDDAFDMLSHQGHSLGGSSIHREVDVSKKLTATIAAFTDPILNLIQSLLMVTHSLTHSLTHTLTHSLTQVAMAFKPTIAVRYLNEIYTGIPFIDQREGMEVQLMIVYDILAAIDDINFGVASVESADASRVPSNGTIDMSINKLKNFTYILNQFQERIIEVRVILPH